MQIEAIAPGSTTLTYVLLINAVMFAIEFGAGIRADSLSLTGDSLDMLGGCAGLCQQLVCHQQEGSVPVLAADATGTMSIAHLYFQFPTTVACPLDTVAKTAKI